MGGKGAAIAFAKGGIASVAQARPGARRDLAKGRGRNEEIPAREDESVNLKIELEKAESRDPLYLPACPSCSSLRHDYGRGDFRRPSFHFGRNASRWTLTTRCLPGCTVWQEPGWIAIAENTPADHQSAQSQLAKAWRERVLAFSFPEWSDERKAEWRNSIGGAWL